MKMTCQRNVLFSHHVWFAHVATASVRVWQMQLAAMYWLVAAQKVAKSSQPEFCRPDLSSFYSMAQAGEKQISNSKLNMIRKRADFLAARKGVRANAATLRIETFKTDNTDSKPRLGLTVTKKNGNAVMRNRIKRRMRAAIICNGTGEMRAAHDYVFISRPNALNAPFDTLRHDVRTLIENSHKRLDDKNARS